jgi:hypothetical protein
MAVSDQRRGNAERNYQRILAERLAAAKAVAVALGPNSRRQLELDTASQVATEEFLVTQTQLDNRAPNLKIEDPRIFWFVALVVFFAEATFNRVVVEMAAPVPTWFAFVISGVVSALLVWFAHLAGALLRQMWSEINRSLYVMNVLVGTGLIIVDLLGVLAIIALRGFFATADTGSDVNIFDAASTILTLNADVLFKALAVPEAAFLGGVNAAALVLAFVFGALSHDSEQEYHARYVEKERCARARATAIDRYEQAQERVFRRHRHALNRAIRAYVGSGGSVDALPRDDFKAHRLDAESEAPPPASPQPDGRAPLRSVPTGPGAKKGADN